jgi:surface protein
MDAMFVDCESLTGVDALTSWNTSNVGSAVDLFNGCSSLADISPLKDWDISNMSKLNGMFEECEALENISGLSDWDISNAESLENLFAGCAALNDISGLEKWGVSDIKSINEMFKDCESLENAESLDFWTLKDIQNASNVFENCVNLKRYPIWYAKGEFRGINPFLKDFIYLNKTTHGIFDLGDLEVLIILKDGTNLTRWEDAKNRSDILYVCEDLSGVTDLSERYLGLTSLKAIYAFGVDSAEKMNGLFLGCESLVDISLLKSWDVSNVKKMIFMFHKCKSLKHINPIASWNVSNVEDMSGMFLDCVSLFEISHLNGWDISGVKSIRAMFGNCQSLISAAVPDWNVSNVVNMSTLFLGCISLAHVSFLNPWIVSDDCDIKGMFHACRSLKSYPVWYVEKIESLMETSNADETGEDLGSEDETDGSSSDVEDSEDVKENSSEE